MAGETILVVDDDVDIREIISMYLEKDGYRVYTAADGTQALTEAFSLHPDLIILDLMLPGLDGIEVCQELRRKLAVPILFLSCKATAQDKTIGLLAGGDDYISKPFDSMELLARVKAHLRRNRMLNRRENDETTEAPSPPSISYPGLTIDLNCHMVKVRGEEVVLSPKEFQILVLLAQNPHKVFSNEELFQQVWETESFGDFRTVLVHISNIRKKIEVEPKNPVWIQTIIGVGYKFSPPLENSPCCSPSKKE